MWKSEFVSMCGYVCLFFVSFFFYFWAIQSKFISPMIEINSTHKYIWKLFLLSSLTLPSAWLFIPFGSWIRLPHYHWILFLLYFYLRSMWSKYKGKKKKLNKIYLFISLNWIKCSFDIVLKSSSIFILRWFRQFRHTLHFDLAGNGVGTFLLKKGWV